MKHMRVGTTFSRAEYAVFEPKALPTPRSAGPSVAYSEHENWQCWYPLWGNIPLGSLEDAIFCAAPRVKAEDSYGNVQLKSYCEFHCGVAYQQKRTAAS